MSLDICQLQPKLVKRLKSSNCLNSICWVGLYPLSVWCMSDVIIVFSPVLKRILWTFWLLVYTKDMLKTFVVSSSWQHTPTSLKLHLHFCNLCRNRMTRNDRTHWNGKIKIVRKVQRGNWFSESCVTSKLNPMFSWFLIVETWEPLFSYL